MTYKIIPISDVAEKIAKIQSEFEAGVKDERQMRNALNRIVNSVNAKLGVTVCANTGELKKAVEISPRYYVRVMDNYKSAVRSLNFKHHNIEKTLTSFIKKYKASKPSIEKMLNPKLPIEQIRINFLKLRAELISGSKIKTDLMALKFEHHAFYLFTPKSAMKNEIKKLDVNALDKKLNSAILVNPDFIQKIILSLLSKESPSVAELAVGVALATGRRVTEIMKTAKFTAVNENTLLFIGQLKTKNRSIFEEIKPYRIPCLVDSSLVADALKKIRKGTRKVVLNYLDGVGEPVSKLLRLGEHKDYHHNTAVQNYYTKTLNDAIRRILGDGRFCFKDSRALYTAICFSRFGNPGESQSAFRKRVLGHADIETQTHYDSFVLSTEVRDYKFHDPKRKVVKKHVKALIEKLCLADDVIHAYKRAPNMSILHEWVKAQVESGVKENEITSGFIRRHCLINGKQLSPAMVNRYLVDFVGLKTAE